MVMTVMVKWMVMIAHSGDTAAVCMSLETCQIYVLVTLVSFMIIIMIIIAFRSAIQDFLQSPHCPVNCLQHICSSGLGAVVIAFT